ncbi:hypothetical protein AB0H43_26695 [Hamadaea sp. NPDC050747]|uniref:hypothetical protein n=1 Tax=Hamadaea sp. NPDC050747 TaxID=3155789 RepID=UPI0033ED8403
MAAQDESWRVEADGEWLARHQSRTMANVRRRFSRILIAGNAVSNAELGPFGGAPRNPSLRPAPSRYAVIRHVVAVYAYTSIRLMLEYCQRCGRPMQEAHHVATVRADGVRLSLGAVRSCRTCDSDSWLFRSHMPATHEARRQADKTVL